MDTDEISALFRLLFAIATSLAQCVSAIFSAWLEYQQRHSTSIERGPFSK